MASVLTHPSLMLTAILWSTSWQAPPCKYFNSPCGCNSFNDITSSLNVFNSETVKALASSEDSEYYYIDDMVFNKSRLANDYGLASSQNAAATKLNMMFWPGGIVFYFIEDKFSETFRKIILSALDAIEKAVGKNHIEFRNVQTVTGKICRKLYVKIQLTKVQGECKSEVGMQEDDVTKMWLDQNHCSFGTVIHEILHALGRQHEHVRPDRDTHVTVRPAEIESASCSNYAMQLEKSPSGDPTLMDDYDLDSIMHYGSCFFSCRGQYTLVSKSGGEVKPNREHMTTLDAKKIRRMFPADAKVPYAESMCKQGERLETSLMGGLLTFSLSALGLGVVAFLV